MPGIWLRVVIVIALSLIVTGSRVKDVSAATFVVDRTDDTNAAAAQVCSGAANDCSLRGAISKANTTPGADIITFATPNGTPFTLSLLGNDANNTTGDLDINDSLTISGNGANNTIIQGATNASFAGNIHDKVIGINQDGSHDSLTVSISGVTIRYGHNEVPFGDASFAYTGGGVDVFLTGGGNSITFSDVVISDNENVYGYGGGVNVDSCFSMASGCTVSGFGGTVTFTNVTISNNKASLWGGGVNLFSDNHNVVFNTSTINTNTTTGVGGGAQGGGINIRHTNGGTVAIHGTAITNNTAKGPGGGVAISGANKASVTIDDTGGAASITGNTSQNNAGQEASGGGLLKGDGANTTTLTNVTISNNHADSQGTGGAAPQGGGIFVTGNGGTLVMTGGSLGNNTANDVANNKGNGGGLASTHTGGTVTLTGVSISGNTARTNGGGVFINGAGGTTTLSGVSTFSGNTATNGSAGNGFHVSAGTLTAANTVTIADNVNIAGGTFTSTSGNLSLGGNFTLASGTFTHNSGTVTFNGSVAQSISGPGSPTFNHLTDANTSAALAVNTNTNVNGNLMVNSSATLAPAAAAIIGGTGTLTGSGTAQVTRIAATADFLTQYTIANKTLTNLTMDYSGAGAQTVNNAPTYGHLKISGTGTKTLQGNATVGGNVTLAAATFAGSSFTLNVGGNWTNSGGAFTPGSGTVIFNGNNNTQTLSGVNTFNNLTVNHTGSGSVTVAGSTLTIGGLFRLQGGTFTSATNYKDVQIDAGTTLIAGSVSNVSGNWTNSGTFTAGSGTVTFNGSGLQNLTANAATAFNNLTVNSGVILVETVAADNVAVGGTLTNQGTIRKAQAVSGAGLKSFGLTGVQVSVGTQGTLAQIQVDRVDSNHANASTPLQTGRYWTITGTDAGSAAATGFTVALALPHNNLTAPKACRYPGGLGGAGWDCDDGTSTTSTTSMVTRSAVTGFSDWAVGSNAGPTAVTLRQFTAQGSQAPILPILTLLAALVLAGAGWLIIGQRVRRPAAAAVRSDPRE